MKASFTPSYSNYYPCDYVKLLLRQLDYQLPFTAVRSLKKYLHALLGLDCTRVALIGSGYGIEATALRHDLSAQGVVERWSEESAALHPFEGSEFNCHLSMFDIEQGPLEFARDTGLAQKVFPADLTQPYSAAVQRELSTETDVVIVFGAMTYIGLSGFRLLVNTAFKNGNAKLLAYSILKYQDNNPVRRTLNEAGLCVRKIGANLKQRDYKNSDEREKVTAALGLQNKCTPEDEVDLRFDLYIAYPTPATDSALNNATKSLVVVDSKTLAPVASTVDTVSTELDGVPHPWHVALSKTQLEEPTLSSMLTDWHTRKLLMPKDIVSSPGDLRSTQILRFANTFSGEYINSFPQDAEQLARSITRVTPKANANFVRCLPKNLQELEYHLHGRGHLIVRGNGSTRSQEQLADLLQSAGMMDYNTYGTQQRTQIRESRLQNVTPWPKNVMILPHNEMTYHVAFPDIIAFTCMKPTSYGGETTMYDCSQAVDKLSDDFRVKASEQNIIVQRRYTEMARIMGHASWQQAAGEGSDASAAQAHFSSLGFNSYVREETTPEGVEPIVFTELNRPLLYDYYGHRCLHATIAGISPYWYKSLAPDRIPPYAVFWEDGKEFSDAEFAEIEKAVLNSRIHYSGWHTNDIMILANPMIAHGRLPLIGERLIGYSVARPARFSQSMGSWKVESCAASPMFPGTGD